MHNREGKRYGDREIEHSRAEQRRAEKTWKGRLDMAGQGGQGMRVGDAISGGWSGVSVSEQQSYSL